MPDLLGPILPRPWLSALVGVLAIGSTALPAGEPAVTDASVEQAIQAAVGWLKSQRNAAGHWEQQENPESRYWAGDTALVVLALLYAGENPRTELMSSALKWLVEQPLRSTYTYATRAHALALVPGQTYRSRLAADLDWLLRSVYPATSDHPGAYDYEQPGTRGGRWDNSNTQFGVLGVWTAADAGLSVPSAYWEMVGAHWVGCQQPDGGWSYQKQGPSTGSMTAAGLASLFVVLDRAYATRPVEGTPIVQAIERGLDWFAREYTPQNPRGDRRWLYYYLYSVERAGRASGYKYFRNVDWFRAGAGYLLARQEKEGRWPGTGEGMSDLRNTAFALMFLCHGRAPLFLNKLQHGEDWNTKLRDAAGMTHYAERTLERLFNWQIVSLDAPIADLLEAPVLYLRGESAWEFDEAQVEKLRDYCLRGGMILAVVGRQREAFADAMRSLAARAFPDCPCEPLASDHPLFSGQVQFTIERPPAMLGVHNGVRTLMLVCLDDLGPAWQRGRGRREYLELGCNIYNYATDKTTHRSRLETPEIPLREVAINREIRVALVRHAGRWNVEPHGWTRLSHYLNNELGVRLLVTSGLALDDPELADFTIAYITGTEPLELSPAEQDGLRRFITGGGTLLADAAGGSRAFLESLQAALTEALKVDPIRLPRSSFLISGAGLSGAVDLSEVTFTRAARAQVARRTPSLWAYPVGRCYAVVYSPLDLAVGRLGTRAYGCVGYSGDSALQIMRNLLLYADLPTREKARLAREAEP